MDDIIELVFKGEIVIEDLGIIIELDFKGEFVRSGNWRPCQTINGGFRDMLKH